MSEPITIWREAGGRLIERPDDGTGGALPDGAWTKLRALTRAEYDALIAETDALRERDRTCPLCGDELSPDEMDYDSDIPPAGAGVCSQCFGRWHDAPIYEKRADAATARAEKAEATLALAVKSWRAECGDEKERADAASARLARAEALLREARDFMQSFANDIEDEQTWNMDRRGAEARDIQHAIDAILDTPTDDDRRGVDGEAIDAQGGIS